MPESTAHPSRDQLRAYNLGQLPPDEAVVVESHISECEPCCDTIVALSSDDTFLGLLKEARQLPTDQTVDQDGGSAIPAPSSQDVPVELAEHPRYEVVGLIGKGGMGDVYKATHRMMKRTVALKIINREFVRKADAVDRFHREVETAAKLSHPNVVTAHDAEQAGDVHFLAMEYVDGVNLSQTVRDRGPLPAAEACDYIRQAAIGLQYAHERGMVHRDIKPHNLMLTADGTVKILDFGLASLTREATPATEGAIASPELTAAGAIMGTPDFISPEQAEDAGQADIRSDIYSLGATLYFLLSGRPPFADGSVMHKLKSHAQAEPEPLESLRDDVPPELVAVVTTMTAKDPEERYLTPREVADALESFLRTWQPDEAESREQEPSSGGHMSGMGGQKSVAGDMGRDWLSVVAKWLFYLAWVFVALLTLEVSFSEASAARSDRVWLYMLAVLCLSTLAAIARGVHRFKSEISQTNRGDRHINRLKVRDLPFLAAVLAGTVYYVYAIHGIVRVEVADASLEVSIKDHTITKTDGGGKPLTIRPGEHKLIVRKDDADFQFETDRFQIRRREEIVFKVELLEGEIVVRKDGDPFDRARLLPRQGVPIPRKGERQQQQKVNQENDAVTAAEPRDREREEELKQLQGDWELVSGTEGGKKEPAGENGFDSVMLQIEGNTFTITQTKPNGEEREGDGGLIELDSTTNPKTIDLIRGQNPGDRLIGIYELNDGALRICYVEQSKVDVARGRPVKRPSTFDSSAGSWNVLWEYRRLSSETAHMNTEDILDIALALLVVSVGVLYTFFPHWLCKKWPPEQQTRQRKLIRIFGPALIVLGLVLLAFQFMG